MRRTSAVLVAKVRETPDVGQIDGEADDREKEIEFLTPLLAPFAELVMSFVQRHDGHTQISSRIVFVVVVRRTILDREHRHGIRTVRRQQCIVLVGVVGPAATMTIAIITYSTQQMCSGVGRRCANESNTYGRPCSHYGDLEYV